MGSRLVLNIRQAYYLPFSRDLDNPALSDFQAAVPDVWHAQSSRGEAGIELNPICSTIRAAEQGVIHLTYGGPSCDDVGTEYQATKGSSSG